MEPAVQVQDLVKHYNSLEAVAGISFSVEQGEVFGILGPNGAGKTTSLECIEGLQPPTAGQIHVLGIDVWRDPAAVKERIGVQLQASAYFDYLTLTEILDLFGGFYRRRVAPDELLTRVQLTDKAHSTVGKLSGGQRQRFTVAASLVNDPEVVFLDEPTTGLDPQARRHLWDFIRDIHGQGRTIILTTHSMEEAEALCQRVAIMDHGKIVALDSPANLIAQLPLPYQIRLSTAEEVPSEAFEALPSVRRVERTDGTYTLHAADASDALPEILGWISEQQVTLRHLEVHMATLEDVFLELTGHQLRD